MKIKFDFAHIEDAVRKAETLFGESKGSEKREAAIDIVNQAVDIPLVPEAAEGVLIGILVDLCIYLYNRWWGHKWLEAANA